MLQVSLYAKWHGETEETQDAQWLLGANNKEPFYVGKLSFQYSHMVGKKNVQQFPPILSQSFPSVSDSSRADILGSGSGSERGVGEEEWQF